MPPLEPPASHYVVAAAGWLELGNPVEARAELAALTPEQQNHPDVLELRWLISADEKNWAEALEVARGLIEQAPQRPSGWLHQAYALRRVPDGGLKQAWEVLLPASEQFPKDSTIPYNLSCYACQMGQLDEARTWLQRALKIGGKARVRRMALADSDLEPLWPEIREW